MGIIQGLLLTAGLFQPKYAASTALLYIVYIWFKHLESIGDFQCISLVYICIKIYFSSKINDLNYKKELDSFCVIFFIKFKVEEPINILNNHFGKFFKQKNLNKRVSIKSKTLTKRNPK